MAGGLGTILFEVYSDLNVFDHRAQVCCMRAMPHIGEFGHGGRPEIFGRRFFRWTHEPWLSTAVRLQVTRRSILSSMAELQEEGPRSGRIRLQLRLRYALPECRWDVIPHFSLTPSVQVLFDPALNPSDDAIVLGGIRARFNF